MVKFITKATLFLALGLGVVSCKTYTYEHSHRIVESNKKNKFEAELNVDVSVVPDFTKRIKSQTSKTHRSVEDAKDEAYFNAIVENQIDVLVAPIYSIEKSSDGKCSATVHGYAGVYKMTPKNDKGNGETSSIGNEFDKKLKDLEKLAKIDGVLSSEEEKVYKINQTCGDCKNNDPLSLLTVTTNKSSLVDTYEKVLKIGNSSSNSGLSLPSMNVSIPKFLKKNK
jgi:hypothetical protein